MNILQIPEDEIAAFLEAVSQILQELNALAAAYDAEMADGGRRPQHHQGGHHWGGRHDMPFPGHGGEGAQENPWEDLMPMGNPMDEEWPLGHHGMRDDEDGEPYGLRQRRSAGRQGDKDFMEKARDASKYIFHLYYSIIIIYILYVNNRYIYWIYIYIHLVVLEDLLLIYTFLSLLW